MLTIFGALLLAGSLAAQDQQPFSSFTHEQLVQRVPKVLALTQQFHKTTAKAAVVARSGAATLDSIVLYTSYAFGDSFPQTKSVFTYPSPHLTVVTDYEFLGDWQVQGRSTLKSDNLGRPVEIFGERYEPVSGLWFPDSRIFNYPHGNSPTALDSLNVEAWDPELEEWVVVLQNSTTYDGQDRPTTIFNYFNQAGFEFALLEELSYNNEGDNYVTEQYIYDQGTWTLFTRIESEFEQHREVLRTSYSVIDPNTFFPSNKVETDYDANGNPILEQFYDADFFSGNWTLTETIQRGYDNGNRLLFEETTDFGPDAPAPNRTDYVYFNDDNLAVEIYSEKDPGAQTWTILDKTFYYYSNTTANHEAVSSEPLPLSPNPTTGFIRIPAGPDARILVLNTAGASVAPIQVEHGNGLLDLSRLPAGIYTVTVLEGNQRRSGKVVKQ